MSEIVPNASANGIRSLRVDGLAFGECSDVPGPYTVQRCGKSTAHSLPCCRVDVVTIDEIDALLTLFFVRLRIIGITQCARHLAHKSQFVDIIGIEDERIVVLEDLETEPVAQSLHVVVPLK